MRVKVTKKNPQGFMRVTTKVKNPTTTRPSPQGNQRGLPYGGGGISFVNISIYVDRLVDQFFMRAKNEIFRSKKL